MIIQFFNKYVPKYRKVV